MALLNASRVFTLHHIRNGVTAHIYLALAVILIRERQMYSTDTIFVLQIHRNHWINEFCKRLQQESSTRLLKVTHINHISENLFMV